MGKKSATYLYFPLLFLICLWLIKLIEYTLGISFTNYGIFPQKLSSLPGIFTSVFIHGDFNHLIANSLPVFFLSMAIFYFYPRLAFRIIIFSWLLTGIGVWLGGRFAWHIGASGLVYAFASFLFFAGVVSKNRKLLAISLLVIFLYGGIIWGIFPRDPHTSWEAHLFGFFAGIILAYYYAPNLKFKTILKKKKQIDDFVDFDTSSGTIDFKYHFNDNEKQ